MKRYLLLLILSSVAFTQTDFQSDIQPIFNESCALAGCHVAGHITGLNLSSGNSYELLVNVSSTNYPSTVRIEPFSLANSVLYNKIANTNVYGQQMPPPPNQALSSSNIQLIEDWINEGAAEEFKGTISGGVSLNEDHSFGQLHLTLNLPGGGTIEHQQGEDPPFNVNYVLSNAAISEGGPYSIESYFDVNDNNQFDGGEPSTATGDLYVPATNVLENIDLGLASGTIGGEYSYDFEVGGPVEVFEGAGANDLDGTAIFSIEFWIMFHGTPATDQIIFERLEPAGSINDLELRWDVTNQQFELMLGPEQNYLGELIAGGMDPFDTEWHHIYIQYVDGSNRLEFFFDGLLKNFKQPTAGSPTIPGSDNPIRFGTNLAASIDEVRIRKAAEDRGSSFVPNTGPYDGGSVDATTIVLWHCNENGGNDLIDVGFFGTNVGMVIGTGSWDFANPWDEFSGIQLWMNDYSSNWIDLEWSRWPDADVEFQKYELRRQINSPGVTESSPSVYLETSVEAVNWRDNDISQGNNYYYKMFMYNHSGLQYETGEFMFTPSGGETGKITLDIHVNRAIAGNIHLELYYPGNDPTFGSPDETKSPVSINLAASGQISYEFTDLEYGNGYSVIAFIDAQGSPSSGYDICDESMDLISLKENIAVTSGSIGNVDVIMEECSSIEDYPVIDNFFINSGEANTDGSNDVTITVDINADTDISEAKLIYYLGGDSTSKFESPIAFEAGAYAGSIQAADITMEGLRTQVYARSNNGDESRSDWYEIPVVFNSYSFSSLAAEQYAMVSFPGSLNDDGVGIVLGNSLGSYDPAQWRSFRYNNSSESYDENSGSFQPGEAIWVISRQGADLISGSGGVTSLENPYTVSLDLGWNMIGNPYAFYLAFPDQVSATGDVAMTLYRYTGNGYEDANEIVPGEGYWFWSYEDGAQLDFDPFASGSFQKQMVGGWQLDLRASIDDYHDNSNKIGAHPLAKNGRDAMDAPEPPVIGKFVQLAFHNDDWASSGIYSKDIRQEGEVNYIWDIAVKSNIAGHISIDAFDTQFIPGEFDAVLVDVDNKIQHDLRTGKSYKYVSIGDEQNHRFQVIIGLPENVSKTVDELGILPSKFSVDQNIPNPFNPVTAIRIQLVQDAVVTMKVFNILGEEVTTLIHNEYMESGYRQIIFNGRDNADRQLPSGLYFYQTIIKNNQGQLFHINTKKMILVK